MAFVTSRSFPLANKPHRCTWCGEQIPKGERYWKWKSVEDSWSTSKMHDECLVALNNEWAESGETEYFPYENERPKT